MKCCHLVAALALALVHTGCGLDTAALPSSRRGVDAGVGASETGERSIAGSPATWPTRQRPGTPDKDSGSGDTGDKKDASTKPGQPSKADQDAQTDTTGGTNPGGSTPGGQAPGGQASNGGSAQPGSSQPQSSGNAGAGSSPQGSQSGPVPTDAGSSAQADAGAIHEDDDDDDRAPNGNGSQGSGSNGNGNGSQSSGSNGNGSQGSGSNGNGNGNGSQGSGSNGNGNNGSQGSGSNGNGNNGSQGSGSNGNGNPSSSNDTDTVSIIVDLVIAILDLSLGPVRPSEIEGLVSAILVLSLAPADLAADSLIAVFDALEDTRICIDHPERCNPLCTNLESDCSACGRDEACIERIEEMCKVRLPKTCL